MKAVLISKPTKAEDITFTDIPMPTSAKGWVVVKIHAFGLNHSEQILREFEINNDYIHKPIVPGIEAVGEIFDPSDSHFKKGDKVIAVMGGMGRSFNGSYEEYAVLPSHHVFKAETPLSYEELGAVPETYFTAWGSLFHCLHLKKEDHLLIRGATCALGYVAIQIAKALGCEVSVTTHRREKISLLLPYHPDHVFLDEGSLKDEVHGITKALELVGPKTVLDTLSIMEEGGIVCNTGILGNVYALNNFDPIKDIPNGVYLTGFFSNYPKQKDFDDILHFLEGHHLKPIVGKVYPFIDIKQALLDLDHHKVDGKIVISLN